MIVGVGGIADRNVKSILQEGHRHHLQRLVLLVNQSLLVPLVQLHRRIFISAEQRRGSKIGEAAEGNHVVIIGKSRKLLHQLRFFPEDVGNVFSHRPVQHDDHHIFSRLAQAEVWHLIPVSNDNLIHGLLDGYGVPYRHTTQSENGHQQRRLGSMGLFYYQQIQPTPQTNQDAKIDKPLREGKVWFRFILQIWGNHTEIRSEEHVIHQCGTAGNPEKPFEQDFSLGTGKPVKDIAPHKEGTCRQA